MKVVLFVFLSFFLLNSTLFAQSGNCPVSDSERNFMEDALQKFVFDAVFTAGSGVNPNGFPTKVHFGYASTLLGQIRFDGGKSDPGIRENASLPELCTEQKTFEPTCRSQNIEPENLFWREHDVCVQISCEAKGMYKAEMEWITLPGGEKTRFSYSATNRQQIVYDPAPVVTYRLIDRIPGRLIVTGQLLASAIIKKTGENVRALYEGDFTAVSTEQAEGLSSLILHMSFPSVSATPTRAELLLHRHTDSAANGSIEVGDRTLANLTLRPGQALEISWIAACR